jgi:hypothetical protein
MFPLLTKRKKMVKMDEIFDDDLWQKVVENGIRRISWELQ